MKCYYFNFNLYISYQLDGKLAVLVLLNAHFVALCFTKETKIITCIIKLTRSKFLAFPKSAKFGKQYQMHMTPSNVP
jgi:hypothetical protein